MKVPNRSRRPGRRAAVVLAVATLAACAPGGAAPPPPSTTAAPAVEPPPLEWAPCGDGFDCATLAVPVDHADPDGATTDLALIRHRATDPQRRTGVLFTNPGGPGGPVLDFVRSAVTPARPGAPTRFGPDLIATHDIIGMDPRGIGASNPVGCLTDAQREQRLAVDVDPDLPGGRPLPQLEQAARELAEGCAANTDPGYLARVATDDVARDMERVRVALGEQQIDYLGFSYGTLLGVTYAELFPGSVRRMVLDAPAHPVLWQDDPIRALDEQVVSAERQLDLYLDTCRAEGAACPFGDGDPAAAFDALVDRLEADPLPVPAAPPAPAGALDGAALTLAARAAVFTRDGWPVLTAALVAADRGDGSLAHALAQSASREADGTPSPLGEGNLAVNCLDKVPVDRSARDEQARRLPAIAPRFGPQSAYQFLECDVWPVDNPDRMTGPYTAEGAPPVLVVGGELDSQSPYGWAEAMAGALDDAVLLTRTGVGHISYGGRANGACVDDAVEAYLTGGALPAPGTVCVQEPAATAALRAG